MQFEEQIEKHESVRKAHMYYRLNGFESAEGQAVLARAETMVRDKYHSLLLTQKDL